jgi:hypothetical protein
MAMLGSASGTKRSENTVASSLFWLGRHQTADGSWRFDPPAGKGKDSYFNPGTWKSDSGATALGLLPFLAAGQTHKTKGPYRQTIEKGLLWLMRHQKQSGNLAKGDQQPMYAHGLATIAVCEAYGMSGDRNLGAAAQQAIKFIVASQDEKTGGWAEPSGRPSMSLSAWQIMALTSGKMAGLDVPASTWEKAAKFLDSLRGWREVRRNQRQRHQRPGHDHGPVGPNVPRRDGAHGETGCRTERRN